MTFFEYMLSSLFPNVIQGLSYRLLSPACQAMHSLTACKI